MKDLMIIDPFCPEESKKERLEKIVTHSVGDYSYERLTTVEELENADLTNKRILFTLCLLYTSPSPRDPKTSRMPSSA